jgi:hypothetical protein
MPQPANVNSTQFHDRIRDAGDHGRPLAAHRVGMDVYAEHALEASRAKLIEAQRLAGLLYSGRSYAAAPPTLVSRYKQGCLSRNSKLLRGNPTRDLRDNVPLDAVEAVIGERLAGIATSLAALDGDKLCFRSAAEPFH